MHTSIEPAILYLGTPVVLVSTVNPDGSTNAAPISSCWFLGWTAVLGFDTSSQTRTTWSERAKCVLNVPSEGQVAQVDALALLTAAPTVPAHKRALGIRIPARARDATRGRCEVGTLAAPSPLAQVATHSDTDA